MITKKELLKRIWKLESDITSLEVGLIKNSMEKPIKVNYKKPTNKSLFTATIGYAYSENGNIVSTIDKIKEKSTLISLKEAVQLLIDYLGVKYEPEKSETTKAKLVK